MNSFDTLYKRTKTGAIQQWTVSVEGRIIHKHAGQVGGVLTHHVATAVGKNIGRSNETTPSEQAQLEAKSDWVKKHDEGYKTLADLGYLVTVSIAGVSASTSKISDDSLRRVLDELLPKFNSDANGQAKPMLAHPINWDKVTYPCMVQPKLDGVRALMVVVLEETGAHPSVKFLSRNGKEYTTLSHIETDVVKHFATEHQPATNSFILDGEIYSDELTFQGIISAVKKQRPESLQLKFRAYDIVLAEFQDVRQELVAYTVKSIASPYVQIVETTYCHSQKQVMDMHALYKKVKYEGAMVRTLNGLYEQGQRSHTLMKVKAFDTNEYCFKNFEFGQRGVIDLIAVCWTADNKEFRAKMEGTDAEKEKMYEDYNLVIMEGMVITIRHFEYTDSGLPRFPIGVGFRDYE